MRPLRTVAGRIPHLHLEFLLLGLGAGVAFTWPLALHLGTRLPGSPLVGAYSHCWKHWWTWQALAVHHVNPAWSPLLAFPDGFDVGYYLASFGDALWTLPVTALAGPVAAYNVAVLGASAAGCWAASLLAHRTGVGRGAAAIAGLGWAFCPHHLGFLQGGAVENLANPWFPLLVLALLMLLGHPVIGAPPAPPEGRRAARLAGVVALCLFLLGMKVWLGGLVACLSAGALACGLGLLRIRERGRALAWSLAGLAAGAVALAIAARILLPPLEDPRPLVQQVASADWGAVHQSWKRHVPEARMFLTGDLWLNQQIYAVLAVLALLGLADRRGRFWMALALPFLIDIVVPSSWTHRIVLQVTDGAPGLLESLKQVLVNPDRRLFPLHLCFALAAAQGAAWIQARLARRLPRLARAVPVLMLAAWMGESWATAPVTLPVQTFPARDPEYTRVLAAAGSGAVVDLPLTITGTPEDIPRIKAVRSRFVFDQTLHGRPTTSSVGSRLLYSPRLLPVDEPVLWILHQRTLFGTGDRPLPQRWSPTRLRNLGFRWMVLHPDDGEETAYRRLAHDLAALCGDPRVFPDGVMLFELPLHTVYPIERPLDPAASLPAAWRDAAVPPLPRHPPQAR